LSTSSWMEFEVCWDSQNSWIWNFFKM